MQYRRGILQSIGLRFLKKFTTRGKGGVRMSNYDALIHFEAKSNMLLLKICHEPSQFRPMTNVLPQKH